MRSTHEGPLPALAHLVVRARPRYGGYLVHLGVAVIAVGVISSQMYQQSREVTLRPGESTTIGRYTLTHQKLTERTDDGTRTVTAELGLSDDGGPVRTVTPGKIFYANFNDQPATHVAIETQRLEDLYLVLSGWGDDGSISLVAIVNPMVSLIWFGGLVLLIGAIVSLWPERTPAVQRVPVRRPEPAVSPTGISPASASGPGVG
jgi:cytochrome c-type biogenesis protein CcmF